jgi:hypothetical protein
MASTTEMVSKRHIYAFWKCADDTVKELDGRWQEIVTTRFFEVSSLNA